MNATYSETTKQEQAELLLLQQATACLEEVIGPSIFIDQLRAEWDQGQDPKGRRLYTLRLSVQAKGVAESVSASFTPRQLRDRRELHWRLRELWGDLLQAISHKLIENLTKGSDGA